MSDVGLPPDPGDALPNGDGIGRGRLRRTAPLAALTARTAGEAVVVGLRGKLTGADSTEFHVRTAERYAELLGRSKGALMKAGQMLSFVSARPRGAGRVPVDLPGGAGATARRRTADGAGARARGARARARPPDRERVRRVRLGAAGGGLDRPGTRGATARRSRGRGEDPVSRGGGRDPRRPEEHRAAGHVPGLDRWRPVAAEG